MKQLSKKLTLVLLLFLSAVLVLCGFSSLMPVRAEEGEEKVHGHEETAWYTLDYTSDEVTFLLDANYRSYLDANAEDLTGFRGVITKALREIMMEDIMNSIIAKAEAEANGPAAANISGRSAITAYAIGWDDFDPSKVDKADLGKYKDYIQDLLTQKDEEGNFGIENYLDGKYDAMIEMAVGQYLETHEVDDDTYQKMKDTVDSIVKEAIEDVFVPDNFPDKEFKEGELEALKKDCFEQATDKTSEIVDRVEENGGKPTIEFADLIKSVKSVTVDGAEIYNGAAVQMAGLKALIKAFPRPAALATYTDEQMKSIFATEIGIKTDFGDIDFKVKVGFDGDCRYIRKAAQLVADHFDLAYSEGTLTVNARMPEVFTKAMLALTKTTHFSDSVKHSVFAAFSKSADEIFDKVTGYSLEQLVGFFKSVDYQKWFSNFLSADFINSYFGNYLSKVFSRPLADSDIDRVINKLASFVAPRLEHLSEMTAEEVKAFLLDNVPGASRLGADRLQTAATKLLNILKKVDWANFDAAYVRDLLAKSNFNETVESYLEQLGSYENIYSRLMTYVEKLYNYLPERFKDGSILNTYLGDGELAYEGSFTVDLEKIFGKLSDMAANRGFDRLASLLEKATFAVDETVYNLNLDLDLQTQNIGKVTYMLGDTEALSGLLPAGADVAFFSNLEEVQGYPILRWEDAEGNEVTEMPAEDIVLYAITDFNLTASEGVDVTYDKSAHEISVTAEGVDYVKEYTYQWYVRADASSDTIGEPVEGADQATLGLTNVKESGFYTCVVTSEQGVEKTSDPIEVKIAKREVIIDLSKATWENNTVTYTGQNFVEEGGATLDRTNAIIPQEEDFEIFIKIVYRLKGSEEALTEVIDAGEYVLAAICEAENDKENTICTYYPPKEGIFTVKPKVHTVDLKDASWNPTKVTYNGKDFMKEGGARLVGIGDEDLALLVITYSQDGKACSEVKNAGTYTLKVAFNAELNLPTDKSLNEYYEIINDEKLQDANFIVEKLTITFDLSEATWSNLEVTYNGKDFMKEGGAVLDYSETGVTKEDFEKYISIVYKQKGEAVSEVVHAGTYDLEVVCSAKDNENITYKFIAPAEEATFTVKQLVHTIDLKGAKWENTEVTYSGENFALPGKGAKLTGVDDLLTYLVIQYWKAGDEDFSLDVIDAGTWELRIAFTDEYITNKEADEYYEFINDGPLQNVPFTVKALEISIDLSKAEWGNTTVTYNGKNFVQEGGATLDYSKTDVTKELFDEFITIEYRQDDKKCDEVINVGLYALVAVCSAVDSNNIIYHYTAPKTEMFTVNALVHTIDLTNASWTNTTVTYNGKNFVQEGGAELEGVIPAELREKLTILYFVKDGTGKALQEVINAGEYQLQVVLKEGVPTSGNEYYELNGEENLNNGYIFKVNPKEENIDLSGAKWQNDTAEYTGENLLANGGGASLTNLNPEYLKRLGYKYSLNGEDVDEVINAGHYTIEVYLLNDLSDDGNTHYTLTGNIDGAYTVTKVEIEISFSWGTQEFEEDGKEHTLTYSVSIAPPKWKDQVVITPEGTFTATAKGSYDVTLTFTLKAGAEKNFILVGADSDGALKKSATLTIKEKTDVPPEPPVKDNTYTSEDGDVIVIDQDGVLPDGAVLHTVKKDISALSVDLKNIREGFTGQLIAVYEVTFQVEGKDIVPRDGHYTIKIRIPSGQGADANFAGIFINTQGAAQDMGGSPADGFVVFTTTHFSTYGIATLTEIQEANLWWLWTLLIIIIVLLLILIILLVVLLLRKQENAEETEETPEEEVAAASGAETLEDEEPIVRQQAAPVVPVGTAAGAAGVVVMLPSDDDLVNVLDRSFTSRLVQADDAVKDLYAIIKNELLSYKGVKSRVSWNYDTYNKGREKLVKLQVRGKTLVMYIALDPATLDAKYHHKDMSGISKYKDVPTRFKIRSPRSVKYAKELIALLMQRLGATQGEVDTTKLDLPYQTTEALLQIGLIRMKKSARPFWIQHPTAAAAATETAEAPAEAPAETAEAPADGTPKDGTPDPEAK